MEPRPTARSQIRNRTGPSKAAPLFSYRRPLPQPNRRAKNSYFDQIHIARPLRHQIQQNLMSATCSFSAVLTVGNDQLEFGVLSVSFLISLGYGIVLGPRGISTSEERLAGYRRALGPSRRLFRNGSCVTAISGKERASRRPKSNGGGASRRDVCRQQSDGDRCAQSGRCALVLPWRRDDCLVRRFRMCRGLRGSRPSCSRPKRSLAPPSRCCSNSCAAPHH
jgi:hypothetical protein